MHNFRDFNIKTKLNTFIGEKIPVKKLLNLSVTVTAYKIEPSKQKPGTELLTMQIERFNGERRVVFTGSKTLIDQIKQVPKDGLPFAATIVETNDCYEFT